MALNKIRTVKGFDASYWSISDFSWEKSRNTVCVILKNYKDRDTRLMSLKNSIDPSAYVTVNVPEEVFNAFMETLYNSLKSAQTSIDCEVEEMTIPEVVDEFGDIEIPGRTESRGVPYFRDATDI